MLWKKQLLRTKGWKKYAMLVSINPGKEEISISELDIGEFRVF